MGYINEFAFGILGEYYFHTHCRKHFYTISYYAIHESYLQQGLVAPAGH